MAGPSQTYDPGQIAITAFGIPVTGTADGTFVNVERNADAFAVIAGADGETTRTRSRDKTGLITVTLRAESPTNDLLTQAYLADQAGLPTGRGPVQIADLNGTTLAYAADAWIKKLPAIGYAKENGTREWVFETGSLEMRPGGNF